MLLTGALCSFKPQLTRLRRWSGSCRPASCSADSLLEREWLLKTPATPLRWVREGAASFAVVRDDLTHPLLGGNKFRKLDGLWTTLRAATDVVTVGGIQSAHATAVAAVCAEHGIRAHLLLRGERPAVPTGHYLYTLMLGSVQHVSRAEYADREGLLQRYVERLHCEDGSRRIAVIPEGAAQPEALLGAIRLVRWLARESELSGQGHCHILVDSGTGATATGLALGTALLRLPWRVTGIALAGPLSYYRQQQQSLVEGFLQQFAPGAAGELQQRVDAALCWVERSAPRRFGKVMPGEVAQCRQIAQAHGILVDPIWTLPTWEAALQHAAAEAEWTADRKEETVVMLHTGGMLGLCGLAQRFPAQF